MPRISEQRKNQIASAFQASFKRDNSAEIDAFSVAELRDVDEMLGERDLNAGYRIALRNRIRDLEASHSQREQRAHESYIRAWNLVIGLVAGILGTILATWLLR